MLVLMSLSLCVQPAYDPKYPGAFLLSAAGLREQQMSRHT